MPYSSDHDCEAVSAAALQMIAEILAMIEAKQGAADGR